MNDRDDPRGRQEGPQDRLQRERVGVAGDPVPDHEYGDDHHHSPDVDREPGDTCPSCGEAGEHDVADQARCQTAACRVTTFQMTTLPDR